MTDIFERIKLGMVHSFLLPCSGGYLLVDSGYPTSYKQLVKQLHRRGITIEQIQYLLLTHHHIDHCGSAAALRVACNAKLIAHREILPFLESGSGDLNGARPSSRGLRYFLKAFQALTGGNMDYTPLEVREDDIIVDGDHPEIIRKIGIPGELLFTPGHTNNSLSILLDNGHVICGDIVFNHPLFTLLGSGYRPIYIMDEESVYQSWQKIRSKGGQILHPSHGSPFPITKLPIF